MAPPSNQDDPLKGSTPSAEGQGSPDWASGLKQLYDAVVDEPLPDAFKDLLDQLDASDGRGEADQSGSSS